MSEVVARLEAIVGRDGVSTKASRRIAYARDAWPRLFLLVREGLTPRTPDCVVWPRTTEQVAQVVALCHETGTPIVPFGAGSGVCGGTFPLRGGVILDLKWLDHVGRVEPVDRIVTVGAGAIGQHLEDALNRQGYTLGHFPSSIHCSTAGGWVAARGAGQNSSRYGKIEDLVAGLTFVDGTGRVHRLGYAPAAGRGPDAVQWVIGSEGVLGVVTEMDLRVRRLPRVRQMRGLLFPSVASGVEAMREMMASGLRPAVLRLYDPLDTAVNKGKGTGGGGLSITEVLTGRVGALFGAMGLNLKDAMVRAALFRPGLTNFLADRIGGRARMILGVEGQEERLIHHEMRRCLEIGAEYGARDLGEGPGLNWLAHRHAVSYKMSPVLLAGALVDTLETATTWDRLLPLYKGVREALRHEAFVMAHFSHAYEDGCSIYFTFSAMADSLEEREKRYDRIWRTALDAVMRLGGTLSHHHGVGMHKQAYLQEELGGGFELLRAMKRALDPAGILNPGKLGLLGGPALPGAPVDLRNPEELQEVA